MNSPQGGDKMGKKKNKKSINWHELLVGALIDLVVGLLLMIISKIIG